MILSYSRSKNQSKLCRLAETNVNIKGQKERREAGKKHP
jgi:hypothetical protein